MTQIAGIVLAAGESKRFGGRKQLDEISGKSLLRHAVDALTEACGSKPFVVLGAFHDEIGPHIADFGHIVINPDWSRGMGTSIAAGIRAVRDHPETFDGALVAVCDQVRLGKNDYQKLIAAFDQSSIVATKYPDSLGVPALFPKLFWHELSALDGPKGAKHLINRSGQAAKAVELANATIDIDRKQDLVLLSDPGCGLK